MLAVVAGCIIGTVTGLVPGLHVNTVAVLAVSILRENAGFETVILIASAGIVHTFLDFIPSICLGAPSDESFLSVLPGQRFFLKGKGHYAVSLTVWGGLAAGTMAIAFAPLFIKFVQANVTTINSILPFVLLSVIALMVFDEKGFKRKGIALTVVVFSAVLGVVVLRETSIVKNPLLPLVSGFFGAAPLLHTIKSKPIARKQVTEFVKTRFALVSKNSAIGLAGAAFVSLFPGIGPSQAALTIKTTAGKIKANEYLVVLGGINTANMLFSIAALYAIGTTRTGIAAAIKQVIELDSVHLPSLAGASLAAIAFGAIATIIISKKFINVISGIEYARINETVLVILTASVFMLSNFPGMIAFASATAIGFAAISLKVKRSNCMAFLMVPAILQYTSLFI